MKAEKTSKFYKDVAAETGANPSNCSGALNEMVLLGLVEEAGPKGFYRQTPIVRTTDIDAEIRKAGRKVATITSEESSLRIVMALEGSLDLLEVDPE